MIFSALPALLHCSWLRVGPLLKDIDDTECDDEPDQTPHIFERKQSDDVMREQVNTVSAKQDNIYQAWLASRQTRDGQMLAPGQQRRMTPTNIIIAMRILSVCLIDLLELLWGVHPMRTIALILHNFVRGVLPAARLHSQARIIDAVSCRQVEAR
jgi:hypothetical protein